MGQSSGLRLGLDRFWNQLRSHNGHRDIRRDSLWGALKGGVPERESQSGTLGKTATTLAKIQTVVDLLGEQADGGAASRGWGEGRQERVTLAYIDLIQAKEFGQETLKN